MNFNINYHVQTDNVITKIQDLETSLMAVQDFISRTFHNGDISLVRDDNMKSAPHWVVSLTEAEYKELEAKEVYDNKQGNHAKLYCGIYFTYMNYDEWDRYYEAKNKKVEKLEGESHE